jgi:octaprenyl-diphosphate synthase
LLHTATLVHDDVVDESEIRRGTKSVNNIWSNAHGVLIGDYIYSKAFHVDGRTWKPKNTR